MLNWKNALLLFGGGGILLGASLVLVLLSWGAIPTEVTVGGTIKFAIPSPAPRVVVNVVTPTPANPPTPTPLPQVWPEVQRIVNAETAATGSANVEQAMSLYADNAIVFESFSGRQWTGKDQIRLRYQDTFAQFRFTLNSHQILEMKLNSLEKPTTVVARVRQRAEVQNIVSGATADTGSSQELWYFGLTDGIWKITGFVYGMPDWAN